MEKSNSTGHAGNVSNLERYIDFVEALGASYNPSFAKISLTGLKTLHTDAMAILETVRVAKEEWMDETNKREAAFIELDALPTRLLGILKSTNASTMKIDDFMSMVTRMRGSRVSQRKVEVAPPENGAAVSGELQKTRSVSQQGFNEKIEHLRNMILILEAVPDFTPNETDLQIASLKTRLASIVDQNSKAVKAISVLKAARNARNKFFYGEGDGMLNLVQKAKAYVTGIYGKSSKNAKDSASIKFARIVSKSEAK